MSSSRQAYPLPSDSIADTTRRLYYGKIRRENTALLRTIEGLNEEEEIRKRRHRDEKSNLQQIIHHLNYQREGLSPSGSIIAGDTYRLASSRGMQAESDCRQIKSIRRPLAPENTRDHGSRPALRPSLHSKEGSVIPRAVEREILKRQTMRLKIKNQELLESMKQREMQLEDMVGVYTRINMAVKGSLNFNGKPRPSTNEAKVSGAYNTSNWKYRYNSSSVEVEQAAESLSTKDAGWDVCDSTYKVFPTNGSKRKVVPSVQAKAKEVSSITPKQTRNNVKRRLATPRVKNLVLEAANSDYQDSEKDLQQYEGHKLLPCKQLKENRRGTFEKISAKIDAVEEISDDVNDTKTRGNGREFARVTSEETHNSSCKAFGENGAKKWVCAVKNKVLLPLKFRRQTTARRGNRTDLQASDHRHSYVKDSDSITKANIKEKTLTSPTEEHNVVVEERPSPLSAGKLQKLIRDKVLSQSQKSSKRANQKSVLLADYMRTLQKHMGIKDEVQESNSPDFSETPFIEEKTRFGCEDEQDREPRAVDRRLEILQRLPASFTLQDTDFLED